MQVKDFSKIPVMWRPKEGFSGLMKQFAIIVEEKYSTKIKDYWDLHKWSIENISEFWAEVWDFAGIVYSKNYDQVVDMTLSMSDRPEWFRGARLNFAENLLRFRDDRTALITVGEDREAEYVTYAQMYKEASLYSAALRKFGLKIGDRVACFMPNRKEAVIGMLGVTSIGGIWTGSLPLLGAQAVISRIKQVKPRILFTIDRFQHDKEEKEMLSKLAEIANGIPSLEKIVIVPSRDESKKKDISNIRNSCFLDDFLATGLNADGSVPQIEFEQVPVNHPVFINYTSGTTGMPKAIVHGAAPLLCIARDFWMHRNSSRERVWLSFSPVGWVTWNALAMVHFIGCTVILFEGVPYFLSPTYLWDMVDKFGITELLLNPSSLEQLEKMNYLPTKKHHLTSLQAVLSGGSFVKEQNYTFVCNKIKPGLNFTILYGCTEMLGFNAISESTLPASKGEIPSSALGVDMKIYDDSGKSLMGELGEVVITKPVPALALGLWGDSDGSRFKNNYFSKYPGAFQIGDIGVINPLTKGITIYGRSDETLKPGGCRFGSSEIYNVVENFPEVTDSICVAQFGKNMTERAVLFLQLHEGLQLDEELLGRIRRAISDELSKRHVPAVMLQTQDIPRNLNGKKMEMIVRKIINNQPYDKEHVANPECLMKFHDITELQGF